jgi:hypothetical protein
MKNDTVLHQLAGIMRLHPDTRDDDLLLYEYYMADWVGLSVHDRICILHDYIREGILLPMESIVRMRRMIQADCVDLRGTLWEKRHKKAEEERLRQLGIPSTIQENVS